MWNSTNQISLAQINLYNKEWCSLNVNTPCLKKILTIGIRLVNIYFSLIFSKLLYNFYRYNRLLYKTTYVCVQFFLMFHLKQYIAWIYCQIAFYVQYKYSIFQLKVNFRLKNSKSAWFTL